MDSAAPFKQFSTGQVAQSALTDNAAAVATATHHSSIGQQSRLILCGIKCYYSIAVAAIKSVTITYTDCNGAAKILIVQWDFTNGQLFYNFPIPLACSIGSDATASLGASGTGGTTGSCDLFYMEV